MCIKNTPLDISLRTIRWCYVYCEQRGRALYEAIITAKISHEDFIDLVLLEVAKKHHVFLANELNKPMAGMNYIIT